MRLIHGCYIAAILLFLNQEICCTSESINSEQELKNSLRNNSFTLKMNAISRLLQNKKLKTDEKCNLEDFDLSDYQQWVFETGYWIGELSFYGNDGKPQESESWNYRYDAYKGFITGNINGPAYRQRNVFLYPPQKADKCKENNSTVGDGVCSENGNSKVFFADQRVNTCPEYPNEAGDIDGIFLGIFDTKTELVGKDNALLYQVFYEDCLFQSQLTTLTKNDFSGEINRIRTSQGFECFNPVFKGRSTSASYYRERKVSKETFYSEFKKHLVEFDILESDTCAWDGAGSPSPYAPGYDSCVQHLEQSFEPLSSMPTVVNSDKTKKIELYKHYLEL